MKTREWFALIALTLLGILIWFRDTAWMNDTADTLPILVALPLFAWLGAPWRLLAEARKLSLTHVVASGAALLIGSATELTALLALGWTLLFWSCLRTRLSSADATRIQRLLVLPMLAFPWVATDAQQLGWWFRLSASDVAHFIFSTIGFEVTREGTNLLVQGAPIAVAPACAGLGTLQAMLIAGCAPAFLFFGEKGGVKYWVSLLALLVMSWLANTLRVLTIAAAAISFGADFAMGNFHDLGGCFVLFTMFCLCCGAFSFAHRCSTARMKMR